MFGDLMLDEYLFGGVDRISPEAPVPILKVQREHSVLGGAGNVAANLKAVGVEPVLVGSLRNDAAGKRILALMAEAGIPADGLVVDPCRQTTVKTRVIGIHQQMIRIDREETGEQSAFLTHGLCTALEQALDGAGVLIISDYNKGIINLEVMDHVRDLCRRKGIPWVVDPRPANRDLYRGATFVTPNVKELMAMLKMREGGEASLRSGCRRLMRDLDLQGIVLTRSEKGMLLFGPGLDEESPLEVRTAAREVFDVSGAGDTVVALFSAGLSLGIGWQDAAMLANVAAGIVVAKVGTATVTPSEILAHYIELGRAELDV